MPTTEEVTAFLNNLGNTVEEIRVWLADHRISGIPRSPACCPIANALCIEFRERIVVSSGAALISRAGTTVTVPLPKPVKAFIYAYDHATGHI